jgi:hypothetical protein
MVMIAVCADISRSEAIPDSRARLPALSIPALKVPARAPAAGDPGLRIGLFGLFGLRPRDFGMYVTLRSV